MGKKFELEEEFTPQDLDTILDALDEWETKDVELLELIEKLKHIPDPPEDANPEYREYFLEFKKHMLSQEHKARSNKKQRRERAVLLKAKIILMNQSRAADKLFDESSGPKPKRRTITDPAESDQ
jgi:hypothetical protein